MRTSLTVATLLVAVVAAVLLGFGPPEAEQREGTFTGFCEASSILAWQGGYLVGDNETEDRLFVFSVDLAPRPPRKLSSEVEDIEALAATPEGVLVVGSQGANKRGERRPRSERVLLD